MNETPHSSPLIEDTCLYKLKMIFVPRIGNKNNNN